MATSDTLPTPHTPTSSPFHSPALTFLLLEKVKELKASIAGYGLRPKELLAWYDPNTSSLKTAQYSLIEDLGEFCAALPRTGMMRNGRLYKARTLGFSKDVPGYILLPTPTKMDSKANTRKAEFFGVLNPRSRTLGWYIRDGEHDGRYPNPDLTEALMTFPAGYTDLQVQEMPSYL